MKVTVGCPACGKGHHEDILEIGQMSDTQGTALFADPRVTDSIWHGLMGSAPEFMKLDADQRMLFGRMVGSVLGCFAAAAVNVAEEQAAERFVERILAEGQGEGTYVMDIRRPRGGRA